MKTLFGILIFLFIFISSLFIVGMSTYPYDIDGFSHGARLIVLFVVFNIITTVYLKIFDHRLSSKAIKIAILAPFLLVILGSMIPTSLKYTINTSPSYITIALGFLAGVSHYENGFNIKKQILFALFPIIMSYSLYDLWRHRIEYGNWTGEVAAEQVVSFELYNKAGKVVSNESLKGKIVLLDFWFISCGPCWAKFPELQRIYEQYESNTLVEIYAVNRPMERDKPGALFSRIEDKGYSFPVLAGTQPVMDALDVYKYPTVMILNQNGEIVFMGEIEDAKKKLESILNQ